MAASALPSACPGCAALSPRVLSATASIGPRRGPGRGTRGAEPAVVAAPDRREPRRRHKEMDPLRAARRAPATDRPWMVGH